MRTLTHHSLCIATFGLALLAVGGSGCSSSSTSTSSNGAPVASLIDDQAVLTPEQQEQIMAAKEALFKKLSGRLMEALSTKGPVEAINVCQVDAPKIAAEVGQELSVRIGRTGVRLRNPHNAAPEWASQMVQDRRDAPWFGQLKSGTRVGLLPIKLQPQCAMCHGPKDQIAPDVLERLKVHYPDDAATGFREGELRGWFWVEVDPA